MSRTKKILFCLISFLLLLTLVCSFRFTAEDMKPVQHWDHEQIKNESTVVGYRVTTDPETGLDVYQNLLDISHILLPHDGSDFDVVVVKLSSPITAPEKFIEYKEPLKNELEDEEEEEEEVVLNEPRLYYSADEHGFFVYDHYCSSVYVDAGSTVNAENTLVFKTAYPEEKNVMALNIDGEFSIESVTAYEVTGKTATLKFNLIGFLAFATILILTLIFEKKLGYFAFITEKCKNELSLLKELRSSDKRRFAIHLAALIFTVLLFGSVTVLVMIDRFTKVTIYAVFAIGAIATILQLFNRLKYDHGTKIPRLFLTVTLLLGLTLCYTSPLTTHSSWDDEAHFSNAYMAAVAGEGDQSLAEAKLFSMQYKMSDYISNPDHYVRIMTEEAEIDTEYEHSFGNVYTHISYLPMILVIAIAKLLSVDMIKILVLCRIANLLAFALITYTAIKKLKSGALLFSAVCLFPCILYLSCSIGYDFWLTAWMLYCFAYVISLMQQPDRKITPVDCFKILLAFFVGCSAKALYCVLMLPLIFIGKDKFEKPSYAKLFRLFTVLTVILILAILVLPGIFSFNLYADTRGGSNVSPIDQFFYVITHPFQFARTLFVHMEEFCSLKRLNVYSATFGYLDGYEGSRQLLYGSVAIFIAIFCIFTDRKEDDNYSSKMMQRLRWTCILTFFLQVVVICGSMYAAFNEVGATTIQGTQPRYLFPMLAPLMFFLFPKNMTCNVSQKKKLVVVFGGMAANIIVGYFTTYLWKYLTY